MKIVLDSNVLISALGKKSHYRPIWEAFIEGKYQLVISESIIKEYEEIMQRYSAPGIAKIVLEIFIESPDIIFQKVFYSWNAISADPDDNKFFDIAVAANADYLVTNDRHFDLVKTLLFPNIKVVSAEDFLTIMK
ncbi:MAG: putative toxin-antitoxin system toxin component, PIN family [Daejeonella sp.]